jgi:hypothetical protein
MNIFQKIAVFVLLLIGLTSLLCGLGGFFYAILLSYSQSFQIDGMSASYGIFSGAFDLILGLAFLLFSAPLGKLLGNGLDHDHDHDDQ